MALVKRITPAWSIPLETEQLAQIGLASLVWNQIDNLLDLHAMALTKEDYQTIKTHMRKKKFEQRLKMLRALYHNFFTEPNLRTFCLQLADETERLADVRNSLSHSFFWKKCGRKHPGTHAWWCLAGWQCESPWLERIRGSR